MKRWLKKNKIYFETLSTTLLAIMALIVSVVSITVSQNQLENEELLNQPLIKISNEVFSYSGNEYDSRFLIIENEGTPISAFSSTLYTLIKIEANKKPFGKSIDRQTILIPIQDYFGGSITTNNFKGELKKYIGINNNNLLHNIQTDFGYNYDKEFPMTFLSLIQFMEVSFKDYKGKKISKTFEVHNYRDGFEIEKNEEIEAYTTIWKENPKLYIYNLKSEDIRDLIIKKGS